MGALDNVKDYEELVQIVRGNPKALDERDALGQTYLYLACWEADANLAEMLIDLGADVTIGDNRGRTPLHCAVMFDGMEGIVGKLLEKGANPNAPILSGGEEGKTPLHLAVYHAQSDPLHDANDLSVIEVLIQHGADVNAGARAGTPLDIALQGSRKTVAEFIRARGGLEGSALSGSTPTAGGKVARGAGCSIVFVAAATLLLLALLASVLH